MWRTTMTLCRPPVLSDNGPGPDERNMSYFAIFRDGSSAHYAFGWILKYSPECDYITSGRENKNQNKNTEKKNEKKNVWS